MKNKIELTGENSDNKSWSARNETIFELVMRIMDQESEMEMEIRRS